MFASQLRNLSITAPPGLLTLFVLLILALAPAYAQTTASEAEQATSEIKHSTTIENLAAVQKSIEVKQAQLRELKNTLATTKDNVETKELEQKILRIREDIDTLQASFEHILLGGINRSVLNEAPEKKINWQEELEQVIRPLLSTLKEVTAKPREIDNLRRNIERKEAQIKVEDKIIEAIDSIRSQDLPPSIAEQINQLKLSWEQRREDARRELEISKFKLNSLQSETDTWRSSAAEMINDFIRGRGLTLLIAVATVLLVWLVTRGVLMLFLRWFYKVKRESGLKRAPLLFYGYRLATAVVMTFAVLTVFYVRGDVLLLTLTLIALVGVALALRQTLPRYAAEVRMLLGIGPVRVNERILLDGVPFRITTLSVYTELRNPALEGVIRIPLHSMDSYISRPDNNEPWFPSLAGDFVLLDSGKVARVLRQSVELVELSVMDSLMQISTRAFIEQNVRNLSREGFGIACSFGVDYQHQAICLDIIPDKFRTEISNHFERAGLKADIRQIQVEFSEAGASSLDYRIYMVLGGNAASAYYKAQRLVAQACVDTCNREGWVIPFTQITLHTASETDNP